MSSHDTIKHSWPIGSIVEENLTDKAVKGLQGILWRLFSMGPKLYRDADIREDFWLDLKADYWVGDDVFLSQSLRRDFAILRGGNILDVGTLSDNLALTALLAASYARDGRLVHIIKEGLPDDPQGMQKLQQYFKLMGIEYSDIETTAHKDAEYDASVLCVSLEVLMKEFLTGTVKFGNPKQINQLNAAAFKIDRWGQQGWRLKGLDVVLFPDASDYILERPEWSAVHTEPYENKWENRQLLQLLHIISKDDYQDLAEVECLDEEILKTIRAEIGPLKNSWCNDQVLWGWAKRVALVCHTWKEGRDYKIEDGLIITTTPKSKDLIRIAAIRHNLARPVQSQAISRITLHRFLSSYRDMLVWGTGLSAFSAPLWRMFRHPVVAQLDYRPPELRLCLTDQDRAAQAEALYDEAGRMGQEVYVMDTDGLPEESIFAAIPTLQHTKAPSGSLVLLMGDILDPRRLPQVQAGGATRVVHLMTKADLVSLLPDGMMTNFLCAQAGRLPAFGRKMLYHWLLGRWMKAKFGIKQMLVDQERRMVQSMDISASTYKL